MLRTWVIQAEFQTIASETVLGHVGKMASDTTTSTGPTYIFRRYERRT